jgi:hypothetical protein
MTELFPVPAAVVSAEVTVAVPSPESAVPVFEGAELALHSTVTLAGEVENVGAVVSTTNVVTDKEFDALPAASVTVTVTEP